MLRIRAGSRLLSMAFVALSLAACATRAPVVNETSGSTTPGSEAVAMQGGAPSTERAGGAAWGTSGRPSPREFIGAPELRSIYFDFDRDEIRADEAKVLDANASWLIEHSEQFVLVEGHADERGTSEYNVALGDRRAKSTRNYLIAHGVPANRISMVSYGDERPICTQHGEDCWSQNRRAQFLVKPR